MRFQDLPLPNKDFKLGETPWLNRDTVLQGILNKHMAPKGKVGLVIVKEGTLDYVWEDNLDDVITSDKDHPIVIEPERFHHVIITGDVVFKIEFYKDSEANSYNESAERPGEAFIK
ncbi:MAG: DUF1971 domain-containing protein [Candidatus Izemoplasma sp.]